MAAFRALLGLTIFYVQCPLGVACFVQSLVRLTLRPVQSLVGLTGCSGPHRVDALVQSLIGLTYKLFRAS